VAATDDSFKYKYSSVQGANCYEFQIVTGAKIVAVAG
jgi:hypothetical protein